jgi:hypothetical protein
VATHPWVPARLSVTVTTPSGALTVWALVLASTDPRSTDPVGALIVSAPLLTSTVTGVSEAVAANAGTAKVSTPAPPMKNAVAAAITIVRILLTPNGVFIEQIICP